MRIGRNRQGRDLNFRVGDPTLHSQIAALEILVAWTSAFFQQKATLLTFPLRFSTRAFHNSVFTIVLHVLKSVSKMPFVSQKVAVLIFLALCTTLAFLRVGSPYWCHSIDKITVEDHGFIGSLIIVLHSNMYMFEITLTTSVRNFITA